MKTVLPKLVRCWQNKSCIILRNSTRASAPTHGSSCVHQCTNASVRAQLKDGYIYGLGGIQMIDIARGKEARRRALCWLERETAVGRRALSSRVRQPNEKWSGGRGLIPAVIYAWMSIPKNKVVAYTMEILRICERQNHQVWSNPPRFAKNLVRYHGPLWTKERSCFRPL